MNPLILPHPDNPKVRPVIEADVFVAPTAVVIGDVVLAEGSSVWFGAVLRGDCGRIRVGRRTNIQDQACLHMTTDLSHCEIGDDVTVGHGAILHGCVVESGCLIGMGSTVLDNAHIGEGSVVAAGSLVPPKMVVPPGSMVRGSPAKVVRSVTDAERAYGPDGAKHYVTSGRAYRQLFQALEEEDQ